MIVLMDVADNAAHRLQLRRHMIEMAIRIDIQLPPLVMLADIDALVIDEKAGIVASEEILFEAEEGHFVLIGLALPRAELRAVAAFVAPGIQMQGLETVVEAGDRQRDIRPVRADINAFTANVVAGQATARLLGDKALPIRLIRLRQGDVAFALVNLRRSTLLQYLLC